MKKILLFVLSLFTGICFGQITLSNTNMPGANDTLRYSNAALSTVGNYTQTGTNFNWNFSTLIPISQGVRAYKSAFSTPYAFFFLGFNEYGEKTADTINLGLVMLTDVYNFYKKSTSGPNAYLVDGLGMKISGVPVPSYYSDKDELYMFPMTYPKYDSTTFKFSTLTTTAIPFSYTKAGYRTTTVDGWGTITTPYGTASCLRVVTTQYSKDTLKSTLLPFPIGFPNTQRSYQWLTTSSKIPYLEVIGNVIGNNFTVTQVKYRDIYRFLLGTDSNENDNTIMAVYPNPVNDKLLLNFIANAKYTGEIIDMNGRVVKSITNETLQSNYIEVSDLSQGIYTIKVTENDKPVIFKFVKQ